MIQRLCGTSGYKNFGVDMGRIVTAGDVFTSECSAEVQSLKGRKPGALTENCGSTVSYLPAFCSGTHCKKPTYNHIFTMRLTTATCSSNGGIVVECVECG